MPTPDLPLEGGRSPGETTERELAPAPPSPPLTVPRDREQTELPRDRDVEPPPETKPEE